MCSACRSPLTPRPARNCLRDVAKNGSDIVACREPSSRASSLRGTPASLSILVGEGSELDFFGRGAHGQQRTLRWGKPQSEPRYATTSPQYSGVSSSWIRSISRSCQPLLPLLFVIAVGLGGVGTALGLFAPASASAQTEDTSEESPNKPKDADDSEDTSASKEEAPEKTTDGDESTSDADEGANTEENSAEENDAEEDDESAGETEGGEGNRLRPPNLGDLAIPGGADDTEEGEQVPSEGVKPKSEQKTEDGTSGAGEQIPGKSAAKKKPESNIKLESNLKGGASNEGTAATSDVTLMEDAWRDPQPIFGLHGYLRFRGEWQKGFWLGRDDGEGGEIDPGSADLPFGRFRPVESGLAPAGGCDGGEATDEDPETCGGRALRFANMRLRLEPSLHLSPDVRIHTRVDVLDNVVLGSTPTDSAVLSTGSSPASGSGASSSETLAGVTSPSSGINSFNDSVRVRRAWAEVTQRSIGELRFGRMGWHWGLGILNNDGAGIDGDFSTDVDRIMGITKLAGWTFAAAWDFASEGFIQQPVFEVNNQLIVDTEGLSFDAGQNDDVNQWLLTAAYRHSEKEQQKRLKLGKVVVNGGLQFVYRNQFLELDPNAGIPVGSVNTRDEDFAGSEFFRRDS